MIYQTVYNTTDQPVVIDADGRTVGGREWASVRSDSVHVLEAVNSSKLAVVDDVGKGQDVDSEAKKVHEQTQKLNGPTSRRNDSSVEAR